MAKRTRPKGGGRFFQLHHYMMDTEAWGSLSAADQAVYIAVGRLYNGSNDKVLLPKRARRREVCSHQQGHRDEVLRPPRRAGLPRGRHSERVQPQGPRSDRVAPNRVQVRQDRSAALPILPRVAARNPKNSPKPGHDGPLISDCERSEDL